ncbi:MAG: RtcB family protein, partial [Planctomycetota bacterium]
MKARELIKMGYPEGPIIVLARAAAGSARMQGYSKHKVRSILGSLLVEPERFEDDPLFSKVADAVIETGVTRKQQRTKFYGDYNWNDSLEYKVWGEEIDPEAHKQMANACKLPISVAGALMPDAHVGYGLPIGGVLA